MVGVEKLYSILIVKNRTRFIKRNAMLFDISLFRKLKLISGKIQIIQKKGDICFCYVVPNAKSL